METILEKYYLEEDSELVYYQEGVNGVDCWFDANNFRQHRCFSLEDFNHLQDEKLDVLEVGMTDLDTGIL